MNLPTLSFLPLLEIGGLSLSHCLILAVILFSLGVYGVISRRNAMIMLLSIEIMLNAANLGALSFARHFEGRAAEMAAERARLVDQSQTLTEELRAIAKTMPELRAQGKDVAAMKARQTAAMDELSETNRWLSENRMTAENASQVGHTGHILALFVMAIAAAEAAVGLAILIALVRHKDTVDTREIRELRE
ncbi:MAG TPA: NADH-quinone oxidoreductase subunit K [Planctomycetota bacterium]|nr:NADH-quinone oxidoreductase subunit K [Planctomycetota bacterium]